MPDSFAIAPCPNVRNEFRLLDCCADFYQEISNMKRAMETKTLASYLSSNGDPAPSKPIEFASYVSLRLLDIIAQQEREVSRFATLYELNIYKITRYLMAALADEIFILELEDHSVWPGRSAWPYVLIEQKLFCSNIAGEKFFSLAEKLLQTKNQDAMHVDLAGVFLLTLKLGFRGKYRGEQGEEKLAELRNKLFQFTKRKSLFLASNGGNTSPVKEPAFSQAYCYRLAGDRSERGHRLDAVSPWRNFGLLALMIYLVSSCLIWMWLVLPFETYIKG
ncbi:DotU family type IV/VI secretion system protein [Undibacterium sp. Xuan67W]|uniref:DotU family type IV/VI secretion system protein n=1 Tax=Undibacterium sp. Xuan67W TaxID=3413057 RepID=UPI003BF30B41